MRRLLTFFVLAIILLVGFGSNLGAQRAGAAPSASAHSLPGSGVSGVTRVCGPRADYSCTTGGYAGISEGWWGAKYGPPYASSNAYGYHNCTLYAAYRVAKNGAKDPGWSGNASQWDDNANRNIVDQTPAVGAVAQWNANTYGHVAYVEVVTGDYIEVTDDNFSYNTTNRWRITRSSPAWPDNFIHFKDLASTRSTVSRTFKSDFDGDGRSDVLSVRADGTWAVTYATARGKRWTGYKTVHTNTKSDPTRLFAG